MTVGRLCIVCDAEGAEGAEGAAGAEGSRERDGSTHDSSQVPPPSPPLPQLSSAAAALWPVAENEHRSDSTGSTAMSTAMPAGPERCSSSSSASASAPSSSPKGVVAAPPPLPLMQGFASVAAAKQALRAAAPEVSAVSGRRDTPPLSPSASRQYSASRLDVFDPQSEGGDELQSRPAARRRSSSGAGAGAGEGGGDNPLRTMKLMKSGLDDGWASLCCAATRRKLPRHDGASMLRQGVAFSESPPGRGEPPPQTPQTAQTPLPPQSPLPRQTRHTPLTAREAAEERQAAIERQARSGGNPARAVQAAGSKLKIELKGIGRELRGILPGGGRASARRASREQSGAQEAGQGAGQGASGQYTPYRSAMHRV